MSLLISQLKRIYFSLLAGIFCVGIQQGFTQHVISDWVYVKFDESSNVLAKHHHNRVQQELMTATGAPLSPVFSAQRLEALKGRILQKKASSSKLDSLVRELSKWKKVSIPFSEEAIAFTRKWRNKSGISVIEPHYIRELTVTPNDPLFVNATMKASYERQKFPQAWDISQSDTSVVIAIVDSGVNYEHEDLKHKLWINRDEIPGNGIDDDQNGWIDDDKGWDFWESGQAGINQVEDNNPMGQWEDHGSHVAGIAAAESDNFLGLTGAGWNARYMAIKAGGTQASPRSIAYGYDGILYAVINGADIVNCSWGGLGSSQLEQDIINTALEAGVLIVAAAGNENLDAVYYPASYPGVLAVGSMNSGLSKSSYSNYGYRIDVLATGQSISSASFADRYVVKSGTSMSAPFVSGLAALLKTKYPDWTPAQYINQIRASANFADPANLAVYAGKLGRGGINAEKALTKIYPGFKVVDFKLVSTDGRKLRPNQKGVAQITLVQTGLSEGETDFNIETKTAGIVMSSTSRKLSNIGVGKTLFFEIPTELSAAFIPFTIPVFKITFQQFNYGYIDYNYISYDELVFEEHNNGNIRVSVAADGTVGFVDASNGGGGIGFIPKQPLSAEEEAQNILFSASLMIREGSNVADRAIFRTTSEKDIIPETFYTIEETGNQKRGEGLAFVQRAGMTPFSVKTQSFTINTADVHDVLWLNYQLTNNTDSVAKEVYVGMYADWDIDDYALNKVGFDSERKLIYVFDDEQKQFAGIGVLNQIGGALAINNAFEGTETDVDFGIYYSNSDPTTYNGFTKSEKLKALSAGLQKTLITEATDVSVSIYSNAFTIAKGKTASFGFIWIYGRTLEALQNEYDAAISYKLFEITTPETVSIDNENVSQLPSQLTILGNYPNPFNPTTTLKVSSPRSGESEIRIFDTIGRKVVDQKQRISAGVTNIPLNLSRFSSGMYLIHLEMNNQVLIHPIVLLK